MVWSLVVLRIFWPNRPMRLPRFALAATKSVACLMRKNGSWLLPLSLVTQGCAASGATMQMRSRQKARRPRPNRDADPIGCAGRHETRCLLLQHLIVTTRSLCHYSVLILASTTLDIPSVKVRSMSMWSSTVCGDGICFAFPVCAHSFRIAMKLVSVVSKAVSL